MSPERQVHSGCSWATFSGVSSLNLEEWVAPASPKYAGHSTAAAAACRPALAGRTTLKKKEGILRSQQLTRSKHMSRLKIYHTLTKRQRLLD
jgi:hypothetical protein